MNDYLARALAHAAAATASEAPPPGIAPASWVPAGPPSTTPSGLTAVHLRQTHGGIPVLDAVRSVRFDRQGRRTAFTGRTVAVAPGVPFRPLADARAAAYAAARHLADHVLVESHPEVAARVSNRRPRVRFRGGGPDQVTTFRKLPFQDPVTASLAVQGDGTRLVWVVRFRLPPPGGSWRVLLDAQEVEPRVLRARRVSAHAVSGPVYRVDPDVSAKESVSFPIPEDDYPDLGGPALDRRAWCAADRLEGNNALCEDADGRTLTAVTHGDDLRFEPGDARGLEQAMVNAFYTVNYCHDFFYRLGFDPGHGNFQDEVDPGAGQGDDPVWVTVWDEELDGLAYFEPFADGLVSELHLGMWDDRHSALDSGVVIHEYVHGVTSRVVGGPDTPDPLRHPQSRALAEGYSDYFALTIQNRVRRRHGHDPSWVYGGWISDRPDRGLRNHAYGPAFPGTYGMLGEDGWKQAHDAGQVWCKALLDLNRVLELGDGPEAGDVRGWRLVFGSLFLLHPGPAGPTFLHARDAVLAEFQAAVEEGRLPDDDALEERVWDCFHQRGMGPAARSPSAGYHGIVEDLPRNGDDG